jgi:hypothetical protein
MEMDCATVVIRPDGDATRAADTRASRDGETQTRDGSPPLCLVSRRLGETDLSQTYALNTQESRPTRDSRGDALDAWDPLDADGDATATTRQDATRFTRPHSAEPQHKIALAHPRNRQRSLSTTVTSQSHAPRHETCTDSRPRIKTHPRPQAQRPASPGRLERRRTSTGGRPQQLPPPS